MHDAEITNQTNPSPFLSIITITRNAAPSIGATLQSVANQKGVDGLVEHWVVDSASTDNTMEIVSQFPHVRSISEPDKGISDAFNKGMNLAQGKYLLYLNSDDILCDDNVLTDLYAFVQVRSFPDWIVGRWFVRKLDGTVVLGRLKYPRNSWGLSMQICICHQAVLLKRQLQRDSVDLTQAIVLPWIMICGNGSIATAITLPPIIVL